jgi:phosphatidylserine/phosphatidylglycerophosphate/cardiolipin synthase-like enzyme
MRTTTRTIRLLGLIVVAAIVVAIATHAKNHADSQKQETSPAASSAPAPTNTPGNAPSPEAGTIVPAPEVQDEAINLIDHAQKGQAVDLEVYELGSQHVITALEQAKRRGVAVRVVLDATERESNTSAPELERAGVPVERMTVPGGIDHVKLLVADGAVLTGGVNLGTGSPWTTDMDLLLPSSDVGAAEAVFDQDWAAASGHGQPASGRHGPFLSGPAILAAITSLIQNTPKGGQCLVVANYLSDHTVLHLLQSAETRGVHVQALLNPEAYGTSEALSALKSAGATASLAKNSPYLHAKVVACGAGGTWQAVVGSANLSEDGMHVNHELDTTVAGQLAANVAAWASTTIQDDQQA